MKTNDEILANLFRSRAVVQRRVRSALEDLEAVTNELETEIARIEGREAVRKMIDLRFRDVTAPRRGEQT
jgi:hypothetical protein